MTSKAKYMFIFSYELFSHFLHHDTEGENKRDDVGSEPSPDASYIIAKLAAVSNISWFHTSSLKGLETLQKQNTQVNRNRGFRIIFY